LEIDYIFKTGQHSSVDDDDGPMDTETCRNIQCDNVI